LVTAPPSFTLKPSENCDDDSFSAGFPLLLRRFATHLLRTSPMQQFEDSAVETTLLRWVTAGVCSAVVVTGLMGFLSWRTARDAAEDADWVPHTYAVKAALEDTLRHVADVETGARTFNITGDQGSLEPNSKSEQAIAQDQETLRHLIADNRVQQMRLKLLAPQTAATLGIARKLVATRRETGTIAPSAMFLESKRRMDGVRATVAEMQIEESKLLNQRTEKTVAARRLTKIITLSTTIVGVILLLVVGLAIRREINKSVRMRGELRVLNADLERRVGQRTAELTRSQQKIHELNLALEHRVIERTAQLEEANKELESFTYSVAHDLRAPLRHIAGFSGILVEEFSASLSAEAQRYLQRIHDGTRKMGQLVDELLSLAQVGRQAPKLRNVDLNSIVKEVIGILEPDLEGRQVEWRIADLPFVECDPTLVKQVFQNLLSNALKYSRPRRQAVIEIGQTQREGHSAIFVRDNGVGFDMKYADKLFGVFQRLHRAEDFEGTGVGLATVQRIIKKHHGRVWAEAQLDKGATFYFTLGGMQTAETKTETLAMGV
jgi:signal transduction histidine kinase